MLDLADEETAFEIARKIAVSTGRSVTVKDEHMVEIHTIPAPTSQ